jgi:hypothetical protein
MKDSALKYFKAFGRKDINALRQIFDEMIVLRDWDIYAEGLDAVLDANRRIFSITETIIVTPENVYQEGNVVIAELNIEIDSSNPIKVVDILEFTDVARIVAIRAYRC